MWREQFAGCLRQYILMHDESGKLSRTEDLTDELMHEWMATNNAKNGIWAELGGLLKVKASVVHNYYHNTWSKRFFENADQYKLQVREVMEEVYSADVPAKELVQRAKEVFCERYAPLRFHSGYLVQLVYRVYYQTQRRAEKGKARKAPKERQTRPKQKEEEPDIRKYLVFGK